MLPWALGCMYLSELEFSLDICPGAGSYGNSVFSFLRSLFSVLYSGYANLHSRPQTHVLLKTLSWVSHITSHFPLGMRWTLYTQLQSHTCAKKRWAVVFFNSYNMILIPQMSQCLTQHQVWSEYLINIYWRKEGRMEKRKEIRKEDRTDRKSVV